MADHSELELVDYGRVAAQIRAVEPRALTNDQLADVVTIVEWMKTEIIQRDEALTKREAALKLREEAVAQREREVALRARTVTAAAGLTRGRKFWFR